MANLGVCKSCNSCDVEIHKHHIIPKSRGGKDSKDNLVDLCVDCHGKAHDVSFKSDKGVLKSGIKKAKNKSHLANDWFSNEILISNFFLNLQQEEEEIYNFLISGMTLGILGKDFIFGVVHTEHNNKLSLYVNFTQYLQKKVISVYEKVI